MFQLCYVGQEVTCIPKVLGKMYGSKVKSLDLSFNCLTTLNHLELFPDLEELILDNNKLKDTIKLPYLPYLHTFSMNNNNVIFELFNLHCVSNVKIIIIAI